MTANEVYENNLRHFKIKKRYGDKSQCQCPAHNDKHASLTITKGRKCTLFYCHAGCTVDEILNAAGLEKKDTFYDVEPRSPNWKGYVEAREKRKIEAIYNYVSINGSYAFTKIRFEGKKIIYGKLQNDRFTYGLGHDVGRKSYKAIYGSLQAINKAIAENRPIFIPEGEKDADTLIKQGYTAWTYGGCSDWQSDFATLVQGQMFIFLQIMTKPESVLLKLSRLKSLLGRDSITARHLYQRETTFIPKFKLVINTNFLPTITDDTVFSSGRINVISFDRHFEPQEQDKDLKNRLRDKQELSAY